MARWDVELVITMTHHLAVDADTAVDAQREALSQMDGHEAESATIKIDVQRGVR